MNTITLAPLLPNRPQARLGETNTPDSYNRTDWFRNYQVGIEVLALTSGGSSRHPNEDGYILRESANPMIVVADETSRKIGLDSREALDVTFHKLRSSLDSPTAALGSAHGALRQHLKQIGPHARVGISAVAIQFAQRGNYAWSAIGDCSLIHWSQQKWWRRQRIRRLNLLHRDLNGQLSQALGTDSQPCADTGQSRLTRGEILLMGSDGVFHEALSLMSLLHWIHANQQRTDASLKDLAEKILSEAIFSQPYPDDTTLILIRKL